MSSSSSSLFNSLSSSLSNSNSPNALTLPTLPLLQATQEWNEVQFNGVYYEPPRKAAPGVVPTSPDESYQFAYPRPKRPRALRIYECHIGMSSGRAQSELVPGVCPGRAAEDPRGKLEEESFFSFSL